LLTAVEKDGNNQMMPIAFAIVEAETKESWDWFIELLLSDLNGIQYNRWSFISDQQKVCLQNCLFMLMCMLILMLIIMFFYEGSGEHNCWPF
jgi:hypothetical protein